MYLSLSLDLQFLCNGLEEDLNMRLGKLKGRQLTPIEALETASGKLTLLGKLLPKLRSEGRKVLIFSQFKIMLDVVEEYLDLLELPLERIDGGTKGETTSLLWDKCALTQLHWCRDHAGLA